MDSGGEQSVSLWIQHVKQGDPDAARELWERYFEKLVQVAASKMRDMPRREMDEEDVALTVFETLCRGAAAGRYEQLQNRDDLWRLLMAITQHKVVDQVRRRTSAKRGGGAVRGESIFAVAPGGVAPAGFDMLGGDDPAPDVIVTMDEQRQGLFDLLRDDTQRAIAQMRLEGLSQPEIAEALGISLRSVERKLKLIRETWAAEITT